MIRCIVYIWTADYITFQTNCINVTYFPTNLVYPFTLRITGIKSGNIISCRFIRWIFSNNSLKIKVTFVRKHVQVLILNSNSKFIVWFKCLIIRWISMKLFLRNTLIWVNLFSNIFPFHLLYYTRSFKPNDFKNSLFFKVSELFFTVDPLSKALQLVMLGWGLKLRLLL